MRLSAFDFLFTRNPLQFHERYYPVTMDSPSIASGPFPPDRKTQEEQSIEILVHTGRRLHVRTIMPYFIPMESVHAYNEPPSDGGVFSLCTAARNNCFGRGKSCSASLLQPDGQKNYPGTTEKESKRTLPPPGPKADYKRL